MLHHATLTDALFYSLCVSQSIARIKASARMHVLGSRWLWQGCRAVGSILGCLVERFCRSIPSDLVLQVQDLCRGLGGRSWAIIPFNLSLLKIHFKLFLSFFFPFWVLWSLAAPPGSLEQVRQDRVRLENLGRCFYYFHI